MFRAKTDFILLYFIFVMAANDKNLITGHHLDMVQIPQACFSSRSKQHSLKFKLQFLRRRNFVLLLGH